MAKSLEIEGIDEAIKAVRSLRTSLEAKQVEKVLQKGAKRISDKAKSVVVVRSGKLKGAIKAKIGKRRGDYVASAYAAVDYKKARHAYLVEGGTKRMKARPYFAPSYEAEKEPTAKQITADLKALVEGSVR